MDAPLIRGRLRHERILRGLARNPAAPPDVVWRLIRLPVVDVVAHRRTDITDDLAEAIVNIGDVHTSALLGHNNRVPVSVRWRLAGHPDPDVRAAAVRHGAPDDVPAGREVPSELLRHLAEDPDPTVRAMVAEHSRTPDETRTRLARDPDIEVRKTLAARWQRAPEAVRRALLTDSEPAVRAAALSPWHPPPPADLHELLLGEPLTCSGVIPHVALNEELADRLAAVTDENVRQALAGHPDLPAAVRDRLAHDPDIAVRLRLVLNPGTPDDLRARLYDRLNAEAGQAERFFVGHFFGNAWLDKRSLGWLREAPLAERLTYLDSPHDFFRRAVASSSGLPEQAIERLLIDPDIETRRIVARANPVPGEVLERLVVDHGETWHIRPLLVERPDFPRDALARFASSDLARLRLLALRNEGLAGEVVTSLAGDSDPHVRRAAAEHPNLPARCLPTLLNDDDPDVAECAGAAPALPIHWMHTLIDRATN